MGYHREDEVDKEHGVIKPQGDEHDEPGPPDPLVQSECQEDEEHQADEPGEQGSVEDCHLDLQNCLLSLPPWLWRFFVLS